MNRRQLPIGRLWNALSVAGLVVLVLSACAVPPARTGHHGPRSDLAIPAGPGSSAPASSAASVAEADAASLLALRRAVQLAQSQIQPVGDGHPDAFRAVHPTTGLHLRFGPSGVEAAPAGNGPTWNWRMALAGVGYGPTPPPVDAARLVLRDDTLEYRRGSLVEWYRNEPHALEQGFTIAEPPPGAEPGQPLRLALSVESNLTARLDAVEQAIEWVDAEGVAQIRYDGLRTYDALGTDVPSRLALWSGGIALEILDDGAEYPLTIDPWIQQAQPVAANGEVGAQFGTSVALSGDTAIVGAPNDLVGAGSSYGRGAAYVFVRTGTLWTQQQRLIANDGELYDRFGWSIAVSGDTAIVGAPWDFIGDGETDDHGSAYVFVRTGTTWTQQQRLTSRDGASGDNFGQSVGLAGDTAIVGAPEHDIGSKSKQGAAYVFRRSGTTWSEHQKLTASDGEDLNHFGYSVAMSGDTAIIGAAGDRVGTAFQQGSAYVLIRSGGAWTEQQKLTAPDANRAIFGTSVALSGDTAVVGAPNDIVSTNVRRGSAYVFARNGTTWTQQQKLTASDGIARDGYGTSVAMSGGTAIVGSVQSRVGGKGSTYVFVPGTSASALTVAKVGDGTITSQPTGISCGTDCSEEFATGTPVTLTAVANAGSMFAGWSGACTGTAPTCQLTMDGARSVTGTFSPLTSGTLTVVKQGTGSGVVTSTPAGINCGDDCQEAFVGGGTVTLTAAPDQGADRSAFVGWSGACSGAGQCQVAMDQAREVVATFQRVNARVSVTRLPTLQPNGDGMLGATLAARDGCGAITHIVFGTVGQPFQNARVEIATPTGGPADRTSGFLYTPPSGTVVVTLTIQRIVPGGGATVSPVVLNDACGGWRTFIGGGPDAFR